MNYFDYETEIIEAFESIGLKPGKIKFSGKRERCGTASKPNGTDGSYIIYQKPFLVAVYKNWQTGEEGKWTPVMKDKLSKKEQDKYAQMLAKIKEDVESENRKKFAKAAKIAQDRYDSYEKCIEHPYLERKGVKPVPGLKINGNGELMVFLKNIKGEITTSQRITAEGRKFYQYGGNKCGSFFTIGKLKKFAEVLVCEGLATAISLFESCKLPVMVACDAGNLLPVAKALRGRFNSKKIIICADNDIKENGLPNPGIENAFAAALEVGGLVAIPELSKGGKVDFNDLHQEEGAARVKELIKAAVRPYRMPEVEPLPRDYSFKPAGAFLDLYYGEIRLGRAIYILGRARTLSSKGWGLLVGFCDYDNKWHSVFIPNTQLTGNGMQWLNTLADMGWAGSSEYNARKHLESYLSNLNVSKRMLLVPCTGWHGNVYVQPDKVIGEVKGECPILHPAPSQNYYELKGSLEGWQDSIGKWAVDNSRMVMAICATLAGFIQWSYDWAESFGIHFYGISSRGKSTTLQAAASCCGRGSLSGGYIQSWLTTDNALEGLCSISSDSSLFLDEMGKADPYVVEKAAYTIAGGQQKARLDSDSEMKQAKQWRCIVLSSGEKTFAGKLAEARLAPNAGQMVRLLDIPAPDSEYGFFENIYDHESSHAFSQAVKHAAIQNYGHIAPAFIKHLAEAGREGIGNKLKKYLSNNLDKLCGGDSDGQVKRVAGHFLLCALAGRLGSEWGLLPWENGEAFRSVKKCFEAWLATRGTTGAFEETAIIDRAKHFIERYGNSRFQTLGSIKDPHDRAGFKLEVRGQTRYLFLPESFQKEICKGMDPTLVAKILVNHNMLKRDKDGYLRKAPRDLPGLGRPRCYTVVIP